MTSSQPASQAPPIFLHDTTFTPPCQLHLKLKFSKTGQCGFPQLKPMAAPKREPSNLSLFRVDKVCYNGTNSGPYRQWGVYPRSRPVAERRLYVRIGPEGANHMKEPKAMAYVNMYGVLGTLENLCSLDEASQKDSLRSQEACKFCVFRSKTALAAPSTLPRRAAA